MLISLWAAMLWTSLKLESMISGITRRHFGPGLLSAVALSTLSIVSSRSARAQEHLDGGRGRGGGHDDAAVMTTQAMTTGVMMTGS